MKIWIGFFSSFLDCQYSFHWTALNAFGFYVFIFFWQIFVSKNVKQFLWGTMSLYSKAWHPVGHTHMNVCFIPLTQSQNLKSQNHQMQMVCDLHTWSLVVCACQRTEFIKSRTDYDEIWSNDKFPIVSKLKVDCVPVKVCKSDDPWSDPSIMMKPSRY